MTVKPKEVRRRKPQKRAEATKQSIIKVALKEFSERGFNGITVREIEELAGVQRNLVSYHFGSKKELWKAAASFNVEQLDKFTKTRGEVIKDLSSIHEKVSYTVRSFVRFCALHPELNRLLIEEGTQESWRIEWLVEHHVMGMVQNIREMVKGDLGLSDDEFVNWYYLMVGGGAMIFSLAPEAKLLFGVDTTNDDVVDRHANMLASMLLSKVPNPEAS